MSNAIYYTKLIIENVRPFAERQELELVDNAGRPASWTLIVGDNGVGKTTLLQCLVRMRPVFNLAPDDKIGPFPEPVEPELAREPKNEVLEKLVRYGNDAPSRLEASLSLCESFDERQADSKSISTRHEIRRTNGHITDVSYNGESVVDAEEPLVLAYGAGRHPTTSGARLTPETDPTASLFKAASSLCNAQDFLYRLDHASLKGDLRAREYLNRIKTMLSGIIEEIADPGSIEIFAPPSLGTSPEKAGIRVDTPYGNAPLDQLGLGCRTVFAWIVDIVLRLLERYENSSDPLREPAIVIVDEIDLHLHPTLQRKIREHLTKHFPNVQFIATSYSPLIARSFLDANIIVLRRSGDHTEIVNDPFLVRDWTLDQLVTSELFGLPSSRSLEAEKRRQIYRGLVGNLSENEREELDELRRRELKFSTADYTENETAKEIVRCAAEPFESKDGPFGESVEPA